MASLLSEIVDENTEPIRSVRYVLVCEFGDDWAKRLASVVQVIDSAPERKIVDADETQHGSRVGGEFLMFENTCSSDVLGFNDPIEIGNHRYLMWSWPGLARSFGPRGHIVIDLDGPAPTDMLDVLATLSNGTILDSDLYSRSCQDVIVKQWREYGCHETKNAIREAIGVDELSEYAQKIIEQLVFGGIVEKAGDGGYPRLEDVSSVDFGAVEIAEWIMVRLDTRVTISNGSIDYVFDLRRSRLARAA
ncbi:hypothetical protein [Nocardia sp. CA-119907]|uniref:hypothetical protein n=1 Tax=Nocardia sp. CA-119907 TaxID=3239973 RepID=UPI003D96820E